MKRTIIGLVAGAGLILFAGAAQADVFSVSADVPIAYSFSEGGSADEVSGYKLGVSLPFLVGFGVEEYTATLKSNGVKSERNFSFIDLFFNLPVPLVNIALGYGFGTASVDQTPATTGLTYEDADVNQYFLSVGYPFAGVFDVHLGYHVVSGSGDVKQDNTKIGETKLDGNMVSLGVKVGF